MTDGGETVRYTEYLSSSAERDRDSRRDRALRDAIKDGHTAIVHSDYEHVQYIVQTLADELVSRVTVGALREVGTRLDDDLAWYPQELTESVLDGVVQGGSPTVTPWDDGTETITRAFESLVSLAIHRGVITREVTRVARAEGFNVKLGEHHQQAEIDFGDPVPAITRERGQVKSFYAGGTGSGKTTAASGQAYDYARGDDVKLLDYAGLGEGENVLYDVPQSQDDLRRVREEHGVPEDITELDDDLPDVEILVPLSSDFNRQSLPYDTERDEFSVTPFTIPASDLSEGLLASLISARVTPKEEQTIRDAYRTVNKQGADWSLRDLAEEIRGRDDLTENHIKDALRILKRLQEESFIRTHDHEYALDWGRIFHDTDTITVFSQSALTQEMPQVLIVAYLLDRHWTLRQNNPEYPRCAVWLREMSEIVPQPVLKRKRDDAEEAIIDHIVYRLSMILRKNRHIDTEVIGDSQNPSDVDKSVRMRFNRYILFEGDDDMLKDVFSWAGKNGWQVFKNTLTERPGEGGIIGGTGPSARSSDVWGISPVRFTPPPWHTHDTKDEQSDSGWDDRIVYGVRDEELRQPSWDTSIPDELEVSTDLDTGSEDGEDAEDQTDPKKLHKAMAQNRKATGESIRQIRENIPNNPDTGNPYSKDAISRWTRTTPKGGGATAD